MSREHDIGSLTHSLAYLCYQYYIHAYSYLPSGKIIYLQPGNTLGKMLQWYNYLFACRIILIHIYSSLYSV
jgi:hypothetical protein